MSNWPPQPAIYEINTWVWLSEIGTKIGCAVDLGSVPAAEWDAMAKFGFEAIWLMGVWERSPASAAISIETRAHSPIFDLRTTWGPHTPFGVTSSTPTLAARGIWPLRDRSSAVAGCG